MYIKVMQQKAKIIEADKHITMMFCGLSFIELDFFLNSLRHAKEEDQTTSKVLI